MSSLKPTLSSKSTSGFDEHDWVIQIKTAVKHREVHSVQRVSIFNVPKTLSATDPQSYTPQQVAIGPYHYFRPELFEMERYKVDAAKKIQTSDFQQLVDKFGPFETEIRACYHKYLDFESETLRWMIAIDASYVLELLEDYPWRKSAHDNAIFRDMVMLENQIPLLVLTKMLEFQLQSSEFADEELVPMLMGFGKELSPFKLKDHQHRQNIDNSRCDHLLNFLYQMIVPKSVSEQLEIQEAEDLADDQAAVPHKRRTVDKLKHSATAVFDTVPTAAIPKLAPKVVKAPRPLMAPLRFVRFITGLINLTGLPCLNQTEEETYPEKQNSSNPPAVQEITIPSVSDLSEAGVHFKPTDGSIETIVFDRKTCTVHLPAITLDVNTKVVLRNLVAYEASKASGRLVVTRYTELMNGIIDTEEDAKLLRDKHIILSHLKSDEEVCDLWNGMSKSIKLTKVHELDTAIDGVNSYYNSRWKVKTKKFLKVYVYGVWRFLVLVATVMILALLGLQTFCSVYNCNRIM